jgi:hypothetical protein
MLRTFWSPSIKTLKPSLTFASEFGVYLRYVQGKLRALSVDVRLD